ncbi:hypothetical protein ACLI4Y_08700 [Natrialbaceae archaeon A-CW3]
MHFVHGQLAWMVATILALAVVGTLSYRLFFLLSILGFVIVFEVTKPITVTPEWRKRLWWIFLVGLVGFVYVAGRRLLEILPPELFP